MNQKLLVPVLFLGVLAITSAQTTRSTISGVVRDPQAAPVRDASIRLVSEDQGWTREAASDASGEFLFALLAPGRYRVEVERAGFQRQVQKISLHLNQDLRLEAGLAPAGRDVVEVTAARGLLKPESASLGATIDNRLVQGLPLDGRNFLELALLAPGAAPAAQGSAGSVRGDFAMHVNGSREDGNQFLLDGVYNGDPKLNTLGVNAAVDAIREFEVLTNSYDASFGRNGGAQVSVVIKSGTNEFHGTAYEFFRNGAMDARNFFAPAGEKDPRYQRNQFGFSLGGPLRKNKTFLFGDYEGRCVREGISKVTTVPTAAERTGDFSQSGLRFLIDPFTQRPFPNNRIPRERIHPIGAGLANLYPLPNRSGLLNFSSAPIERERNDQFDVRLDHQLGRASDLAVRYSAADRSFYEPFTGPSFPAIPGFGADVPRRAQNLMLSETHAFTPSLINELRGAFTRVANAVNQEGRITNSQVGLPVISGKPRDAGLSYITVTGFSPLGDELNNPQRGVTNSYQLIDQATWVRGRSLVKFGFDYRRLQQNAFRDVLSRGLINFVGFTGSAMAELLQGMPAATGVARLDNPQYLRTSSYNFFVNDAWRLTGRLTLNLGVRYEFNTPPADRFDRANVFDPSQGRLVAAGQNGFPRSGYTSDRNNWAPRIGLAWSATPTTIVRGGYGIYFDQSALAPGEGLYFSAPYFDFRLFVLLPQFPLFLHDPFPSNYPFPIPNSATAFQRNLRSPYVQHWNFNIQRQAGSSRVVELGYAGSKGTKLLSARDINQPGPSAAQFNPRPNRAFEDVTILESRASSNYHALQARLQQRMAQGLSALVSYSWAKSLDDASGFFSSAGDPNYPQDSRNVRAERARSSFDVRHRLAASYAYDLPFGKGRFLGGWQTYGVWTFQTGRPFTVALPQELDNSGTGRSALGFGANDRPHALRNARLDSRTPERWFDTAAFALPARGTFGNAGRNIVDGPGLAAVNASLVKNLALRESASLQIRAEFFNLLNRANFDLPNLFFSLPAFGSISSAQNPRHVQFGLKFLW